MSRVMPIHGETSEAYAVRQTQAWCDEYRRERRKQVDAECGRILADPERLALAVLDSMGGDTRGWGMALQCLADNEPHALQLQVTAAIRNAAEESI